MTRHARCISKNSKFFNMRSGCYACWLKWRINQLQLQAALVLEDLEFQYYGSGS